MTGKGFAPLLEAVWPYFPAIHRSVSRLLFLSEEPVRVEHGADKEPD
jgi:hypothetical protein